MSFLRLGGAHPGWPAPVGPIKVAAGVVRLRPVRMRDAATAERAMRAIIDQSAAVTTDAPA